METRNRLSDTMPFWIDLDGDYIDLGVCNYIDIPYNYFEGASKPGNRDL